MMFSICMLRFHQFHFLLRCLFRSFAHFLNWVVFLMLNFKSSFYVLKTSSLSELFCKDFLTHYGLSFYPLSVFHRAVFYINEIQPVNFFLSWVVLLALYLKTSQNPRSPKFSSMISLGVWQFCISHLGLQSILS